MLKLNSLLLYFLPDSAASEASHQLFKRDSSYKSDPASYLDQVIQHWIFKIPFLIDESVEKSEKDLRFTVAKKVTQVTRKTPKIRT